ncbi:MAG TPA: FAD-binding protein, partial [Thermomicrobiales bacterium]|nr:FAD-binding protein [Thermomicrobiales bacterium]
GERFMVAKHELAELAPRDVVARGNLEQMTADGTDHVFLDLRHLDRTEVRNRFPSIAAELDRRGLDLATDLIPVAPAAHYFMGGVVADEQGRTSLPGLLAIGEAACTGVHGANRLASNSLLEGLVFGRLAAAHVSLTEAAVGEPLPPQPVDLESSGGTEAIPLRSSIQAIMSRSVSVVRRGTGLESAIAELAGASDEAIGMTGIDGWVTRNMLTASLAIATAAWIREESRGAHAREDFPQINPALDQQHYICVGKGGSESWLAGALGAVVVTI